MAEETRRRAEFSRIGGHPVLDLINTVQWRLSESRRGDDLHEDDDVIRWAQQSELITDGEAGGLRKLAAHSPAAASEELARVRGLREAVYDVLFTNADPRVVLEEYRDAIADADLARHEDEWGWDLPVDLALPRRRIALSALDLLTRAPLAELGQCQDAECGWVFLDTSARKDRRWCVSSDCGNRNRVREYYARERRLRSAKQS